MKKIFLIACVKLLIVINCFSQAAEKTNYLQKSRNQKITAWVLFGTGAIINIVGISKVDEPDSPLGYFIAGSAIMLSSIPFTIMAHKNKKKAMSLGLNTQQFRQLNNSKLHAVHYPALTLKIRL